MKTKISVSEALKKIELGEQISGYSIDFERIKIESLDVMKLSKAGVSVPEKAIYYDDESIVYDEEFEGDWVEIDGDPLMKMEGETEIKIQLNSEVRKWIESKNIQLDELVENLIDSFYNTQKVITKEK